MSTCMRNDEGRLTDEGVIRIHQLRDAFTQDMMPKEPGKTLQQIASEMDVSLGTVHNICRGKTHGSLHPSKPRYWMELEKLAFLATRKP